MRLKMGQESRIGKNEVIKSKRRDTKKDESMECQKKHTRMKRRKMEQKKNKGSTLKTSPKKKQWSIGIREVEEGNNMEYRNKKRNKINIII